ncbi:hypothetical protein HPG69_010217, partial [Diceros bicornis minor]
MSLKSIIAAWLSSSSTSWAIGTILAFLCELGLFLIFLPSLQSNPSLPPPRKCRNIRKRDSWGGKEQNIILLGTSQARRAGRPVELTGRSSRTRRKVELQKGSFCHSALCPESWPPSLLSLSAQLRRLRGCQWQSLEYRKGLEEVWGLISFLLSLCLLSPAATRGGCLTRVAFIGCDVKTPLVRCTKQCSPEPTSHVGSLCKMLLSPCLHGNTLYLWPPLCQQNLRKTDLSSHRAPLQRARLQGTPVWHLPTQASATQAVACCSSPSGGRLPRPCSSLLHHTSSPGKGTCPATDQSFWGGPTNRQGETDGPSIANPDVQKLLEILITKRVEMKVWKKKEKDGSFQKQMSSVYHLAFVVNMWKSLSAEQDTTILQFFWSIKDKPEQLPSPQQLSYPTFLGGHLQEKCSQLFWGLVCLQRESM